MGVPKVDAVGETAADDPAEDLRRVRPPIDEVAKTEVRALVERALFGRTEPARLGRFVLLEPIANGGMGVVHSAYDEKLDRRVALKLLHPRLHGTDHARARLISEARALARLDHPNVVPVHDVIEIDDQIVIVMELVEGQTLAAWERDQPRTWREIVSLYIEAGRGLAAAHALGVVHRDFKPANAIVGRDGRVRVLDFGLARLTTDVDDQEAPGSGHPDHPTTTSPPLTATGEIVGTLGFTAPEQLDGEPATPASDQFSFCVALHRALHGIPPFAGDDKATLAASIRAGRIQQGSRQPAPRWLRTLIGRGLAASPADRHPSMGALLDELGRERGWRRWRVSLVALAVAAATVSALWLIGDPETSAVAACDGGIAEIDAVWNRARGDEIRAALARVATPYAREIGDRISTSLDRHRDDWVNVHRSACLAHRRGIESASLLDRRMLCIRQRLDDLTAATHVLAQVDASTIDKAVDVVARMPAVATCSASEALQAESPPPVDRAVRDQVMEVRARLSKAAALERVGRAQEALDETTAVMALARRLDYPPTLAETALLRGKILLLQRELEAAIAPLRLAEQTGLEHGLLALAVTAAARRLYAESVSGQGLAGLERQLAVFEPLSRSLRGDRFARPLLLNNAGVVYMAAGQRDHAYRYFRLARAALDSVDRPDLELTAIDQNLAMITSDPGARAALARATWLQLRDALGEQHLSVLHALYSYGHYVNDPEIALPLIRDACALYRRYHPDLIYMHVDCGCYQAFLRAELGDAAAAAALYGEIASLAPSTTNPDVSSWIRLAAGHASLHRGTPLDALSHFTTVIAEQSALGSWWNRQRAGHASIGAALAEAALGRDPEAVRHLEAAIETFTEMTTINEDVENHQRLALARLALAAVLRRRAPASDRANQLEDLATAYQRGASASAYRTRHPWLPR